MRVLGGCWGFLTGYLDDRIIFDVMDYLVWLQGRYPESFVSISSLEVCQECGVLHGSAWRRLMVLERIIGWQGNLWCHGLPCLTSRKIPWKFSVNIFIRSVSRMGDSSWGYLEDNDGSWEETWRSKSSMMSWVTMFDPKEDTLKVLFWYLY